MKANELMIGDWVRIKDGYPFKMEDVSGTSLFRRWTSDGETMIPYGWNEIEPIPLTWEILEKNGFTRFGTGYILKGEHFGLDNPSSPNNYLDNYWLRISIKAVNIKYVHELQHALRLCGIEKEIEL